MKKQFNPSGRATYAALATALLIVCVLTYLLANMAGLDAASSTYAYAAYGGLFVLGVACVWAGNRLTVYEVGEHEVVRRSGVLNREEKIIPFDKVDNISTKKSLANMVFGLSNVYIDTPASPEYEMIMKGLTATDASAVVELLREKAASRQEEREKEVSEKLGRVPRKR